MQVEKEKTKSKGCKRFFQAIASFFCEKQTVVHLLQSFSEPVFCIPEDMIDDKTRETLSNLSEQLSEKCMKEREMRLKTETLDWLGQKDIYVIQYPRDYRNYRPTPLKYRKYWMLVKEPID